MIRLYNKYGENGLIAKTNQNYSIDFKLNVLKSIDTHFLSLRDTCLKFNIPDSVIIVKWKKDFNNFGVEELQPKP
jgi:transposase